MMCKVSGGECMICHSIPTFKVIYDLEGCSRIERYCSDCLEKEKEKLVVENIRRKYKPKNGLKRHFITTC